MGAVADEILRAAGGRSVAPDVSLAEARELERLYQRVAADLARLSSYAAEPEARQYLENLVGRGHAEIHGARAGGTRLRPGEWLWRTFPQTFRRQIRALLVCTGPDGGGRAMFGAGAMALDPGAKEVLMPFDHLRGSSGGTGGAGKKRIAANN